MTASVGAWKLVSRSSAWEPRRPPLDLPPLRQPSRPPLLPPRPLLAGLPPGAPRFFASSDQVDETLADLIDFLSAVTGFLSSFFSPGFLSAGLCSVPSGAFGLTATTGATGSGALIARRGDFIGHGLAGAVGGFGLFSGFLGGGGSFFLRFLGGGFFLFLGGAVGGRLGTGGHCGGSGGGLGGGFLGFGFGFLLRFDFGLRGGLGLRILLGVELGQVLLLLAQVGFLTGDQFSLLAGFLFAAGRFGRIDDRCGRRGGDRRRGVVALHEGAHFLDGDLDRARLARG